MIVDFKLKRTPSYRVASLQRQGPWKADNLRTEFRTLQAWAKKRGLTTGKWIFYERGASTWEACLEIQGAAKSEGPIQVKKIPAATVASVVFDPQEVSPRIVYHGLVDWLRWQRKERTIRRVRESREVYDGDPWSNRRAWARADVQFVVEK
ncbi:MAG: GyrI-like domain-containing protein [Thermoplasmata archaeon]|nr:GyrI-like domain-containing protein [Thermoplasmata archaeon]